MSKTDRIELRESSRRGTRYFWWKIVHRNHNVLLTSEAYTRKSSRTRSANRFAKAYGIPVVTV